jgi:hypothetical protein
MQCRWYRLCLGVITVRDIMQFGDEEMKQKVLGGFVKGEPRLLWVSPSRRLVRTPPV